MRHGSGCLVVIGVLVPIHVRVDRHRRRHVAKETAAPQEMEQSRVLQTHGAGGDGDVEHARLALTIRRPQALDVVDGGDGEPDAQQGRGRGRHVPHVEEEEEVDVDEDEV